MTLDSTYGAFSEQMYLFAAVIVVVLKKQTGSGGGAGGRVGCVSEVHAAETIWQLAVPSDSPLPAALPLPHGHDVSSPLPCSVKAHPVVLRFNSRRLILSVFNVLGQYLC